MSWKTIRLGDCCTKIGSGATPKGGAVVYIDSGVTFIRSQNVYNLHFDYDGLTHVTDDAAKRLNGVTVFEGDVLLNITGDSVARTCVVPRGILPARVNQHVAIIRPDTKILDNRFLNYYLASPYMQAFMLGLAVGKGASRNAMTKDMIANYEVPCPSIETQRCIADILSTYDNLIENNRKQIKLLEEAAQRLYKEWFVDLRFPGYADSKIVDGVPEGWKKRTLAEVFSYVRGKSYTSKELCDTGGNILVNLKNIQAWGGYKRAAEKRFTGKYKEEQLLSYGDIIMAVTDMTQERRLVGHVALVPDLMEKAVYSMDLIKLLPADDIPSFFLYSMLRYSGIAENISKHANGTNVLHLKPDSIMNIEVLTPYSELMERFNTISANTCRKIEVLQNQILLAQQARDRLLPKLMSGEIEV